MDIQDVLNRCQENDDFSPIINNCPYANFIGIKCMRVGDEFIFHLPNKDSNLGNPTLPAIHGGVLAGFLEHSASMFLLIKMEQPRNPKIIDFSIDYVRAGYDKDTYCECKVARIGRRVANVQMNAWQTKKDEPVAIARAQFLLV